MLCLLPDARIFPATGCRFDSDGLFDVHTDPEPTDGLVACSLHLLPRFDNQDRDPNAGHSLAADRLDRVEARGTEGRDHPGDQSDRDQYSARNQEG